MASTPEAAARAQTSRVMLRVLILLAISAFINFVDRGNLSAAAPLLKKELALSDSRLGMLLAAFFWSYAVFQIASGWLVDRVEVKWMLAGGFFVWSVATAATGLASGFALLLAARLILGVGESVVYPSYSKILARYFPENQRGFANSVIITGFYAGPAFGLFFGGILMGRYGWRSFFLILGLISLLWLFPWVRWMPRDENKTGTRRNEDAPGILEILKLRSAWGTCAALACLDYFSYFFLTWMPTYLTEGRKFSMDRMAYTMGAAYIFCAVVAATCGRLSDRWIAGGATPTLVRKGFTSAGMAGAAIFAVPCVLAGPRVATVMVILMAASLGVSSSNVWAITQTLAGPRAAGRWTGIENFVGNLGGAMAPALTGFVLDRTGGQYFGAFAITAVVALLGALCWAFWIGRVEPVVWTTRDRATGVPS